MRARRTPALMLSSAVLSLSPLRARDVDARRAEPPPDCRRENMPAAKTLITAIAGYAAFACLMAFRHYFFLRAIFAAAYAAA